MENSVDSDRAKVISECNEQRGFAKNNERGIINTLFGDRFELQLKECLTNVARHLGLEGKNREIVVTTMLNFLVLKLTLPDSALIPGLDLEGLFKKEDLNLLLDCLASYPQIDIKGEQSPCYDVYLRGNIYPISTQKLYQALR